MCAQTGQVAHYICSLCVPYKAASITWSGGCLHGIAALSGAPHGILELLVHSSEGLSLVRQLALDVWRCEDGLQVHPLLLARHPLVQCIAEQVQLPVNPLHLAPDPSHEPGHSQVWVSSLTAWRQQSGSASSGASEASSSETAVGARQGA